MKKLVLALVVFLSVFVGCTDDSLENLKENNGKEIQQTNLVDPAETGEPDDDTSEEG